MLAQHSFWGWGKEDNNMVRRLQLHGMWPPERPQVPTRPKVSISARTTCHMLRVPSCGHRSDGSQAQWDLCGCRVRTGCTSITRGSSR